MWDVLVNVEVNVQRGRGCSRRANDDAGISNSDIHNLQLQELALGYSGIVTTTWQTLLIHIASGMKIRIIDHGFDLVAETTECRGIGDTDHHNHGRSYIYGAHAPHMILRPYGVRLHQEIPSKVFCTWPWNSIRTICDIIPNTPKRLATTKQRRRSLRIMMIDHRKHAGNSRHAY